MSETIAGPAALPISHVEHCMGTAFSFQVRPPGVDRATLDAAVSWLHAMDAMFSTYRADSEVSRLNAGTLTVAHISPEVGAVLDAYERLAADTDGYFTARPDGHALDLCGYVKGWAVQRAAAILAAGGSVNHCVNGGGDVICAGRPEIGRGWRIGISDPHVRGRLLTTLEATGPVAVATSGLAERGAHILDPHTGQAATGVASVTVVATDLVTADVYATAAAAMGLPHAAEWLSRHPHVSALLVDSSGEQVRINSWTELTTGIG